MLLLSNAEYIAIYIGKVSLRNTDLPVTKSGIYLDLHESQSASSYIKTTYKYTNTDTYKYENKNKMLSLSVLIRK